MEVRTGWTADTRQVCLTPGWRPVNKNAHTTFFLGKEHRKLDQALTVPWLFWKHRQVTTFLTILILKSVGCSMRYCYHSEVFSISEYQRQENQAHWRNMELLFLRRERGRKRKLALESLLPKAVPDTCLVSPAHHTMTPLWPPHILKDREPCSHPDGHEYWKVQAQFPSEQTGWGCQRPGLPCPCWATWGGQGGWEF